MDSTTLLDPAYELESRLAASNPALRRQRGVYFTPRPVASYLVRSVDRLLENAFALPGGLASSGATVVDPACGSGVFLREVAEQCAGRESQPGLLGFDVLSEACQAASELTSRARVVQLNPLESPEEVARLMEVAAACRAAEHSVPPGRRDLLVILGNPPWANFGRQNRSSWMLKLLADYKHGLAEKKHNLGDDFIKFLRWGQHWIDRAGSGVLAFVTNNTYLAGLTHRVMRRSLLESFDTLYFYNLHGSSAKEDKTADGSPDENVFNVRCGAALSLLVKSPVVRGAAVVPKDRKSTGETPVAPKVWYCELRGTRESKLKSLARSDVSTTPWQPLVPQSPHCFFVPSRGEASQEYESFLGLDEIFGEYISGVQTKNDARFTAFSRQELSQRMQDELRHSEFPFDECCLRPYMTAPFDLRWVYYEPRLLGRARWSVMRHMLRPNVGLVFMRQSTTPAEYDHFLAVSTLVSDRVFHSAHGAPFLAPLYLYHGPAHKPNLRPDAIARLGASCRLRFVPEGRGDLATTFGPEDVLHFIYAVVHGSEYRRRYDAELRIGFPRVPLEALDRRLCELGRELAQLHLSAAPSTSGPLVATPASFRLGGYDVIRRWLKQRRGRPLTAEEESHLAKLSNIAHETSRLRAEIDGVQSQISESQISRSTAGSRNDPPATR